GAVRPRRYAAHRRRPRAAHAAPALARRPPAAGDAGPARVLGPHLAGGAQGDEGPLPEASLARGSLERAADAPGEAARLNGAAPRGRAYTRAQRAAAQTVATPPTRHPTGAPP